ncbi:MAG: DUF4212 domain-containing protein [Ramlibacter sp.]|nr:DUF4212 domain-containing protein [Ramlibacter sp.]
MPPSTRDREYRRKTAWVTALLLGAWFLVTFVVVYFARDLQFRFFGWPFSFWMGAQGALIVYVLIIWYYARFMNRLDREYGIQDEPPP